MDYEPLPESKFEPTTPGMTFSVFGDKARAVYDLERGRVDGVFFSHRTPEKLPDAELLQLAQMNLVPPPSLLGEIARRGLQGEFRRLWQAGEQGADHE